MFGSEWDPHGENNVLHGTAPHVDAADQDDGLRPDLNIIEQRCIPHEGGKRTTERVTLCPGMCRRGCFVSAARQHQPPWAVRALRRSAVMGGKGDSINRAAAPAARARIPGGGGGVVASTSRCGRYDSDQSVRFNL